MFKNQDTVYSPYGAYELKATYQRNMLASSLTINGLIVIASLIIIVFANSQDIKDVPIVPNWITEEILPPPSITSEPPQAKVPPPKTQLPAVEQLVPLDDDALIEDETEIAVIDKFAEVSNEESEPTSGILGNVIDTGDDFDMPGVNRFIILERPPELVYKHKPEYPRFAKNAGLEGSVWISVLVETDGSVADARVYKSSTYASLDQSALEAAYKNKFRPAIQNGKAVKVWAAYQVQFVLNK